MTAFIILLYSTEDRHQRPYSRYLNASCKRFRSPESYLHSCNSSSAGTTPASTFFLSRDFINSACFNEACLRASEDERTCARRIASDAETRRVAFVAFLTPLRAGILFVTKKSGKSPSARHIQQVLGSKNESARAKD